MTTEKRKAQKGPRILSRVLSLCMRKRTTNVPFSNLRVSKSETREDKADFPRHDKSSISSASPQMSFPGHTEAGTEVNERSKSDTIHDYIQNRVLNNGEPMLEPISGLGDHERTRMRYKDAVDRLE